jgi:hypothetical protein
MTCPQGRESPIQLKITKMRNSTTRFATVLFLAAAVSSGSCRKALDYIHGRENGDVDCKACNIQQVDVFFTDELGPYTVTYSFNYNASGDPVTVKNTAVGTGNPNAVFKYDKYGRMTELIRPYENQNFETWTKYAYNSNGQIIRDTQYIFGTYIDSIPAPFPNMTSYTVTQFSYDLQDRVIGRVDSFFSTNLTAGNSTAFQYNTDGNLIRQGITYDTHLSLLRTNAIWMFLGCNYSVNNGFQAAAYNAHGLPLQFQGDYQTIFPVVSQAGKFGVKYGCN